MKIYSRRGLHGRVVHDIGLRIVGGELAPGTTLDPEALGRTYDVSRTVVREAVKVLAAKGLLEARPKRGTTVRERAAWNHLDPDVVAWRFEVAPDRHLLRALHELRLIFEPAGARLAAERATERDIAAINEAVVAMRAHHGDVEAVTADDLRLHRAILVATQNELLPQFETLIEAGLRVRHRVVFSAVGDTRYLEAHARVAEAIARRDPPAAEAAMRDLILAGGADVERVLAEPDDGLTDERQGRLTGVEAASMMPLARISHTI